MLAGLFLAPFLISKLGMEGYGLWSLVLVITNYLLTWDLGLSNALVRHVAHHDAEQDVEGLNSVMSTGFFLYAALAGLALTLAIVLRPILLSLFRVPPDQWQQLRWVFVVVVAAVALENVFGVFKGLVTGLQHMHLTNLIVTLRATVNAIGAVVLLQLGYGLKGLALNELVTMLFASGASVVLASRVFPALRINPLLVRRETLSQLLNFGVKVQITGLGAVIGLQMNKLLIGYFLNMRLLGAYELGFKVVYSVISLLRMLSSAVMPAAAELFAQNDQGRLQRLYRQGSKYLVLSVVPLASVMILYADSIAEVWLGTPPAEVARVIRFLMFAYGFNLLTAMGTAMARGVGHPEFETRYAVLMILSNPLLSVVLMPMLGLDGLLLATLISVVASSLYFLAQWHNFLRQAWRALWHSLYAPPFWACLLAMVPSYAVGQSLTVLLPNGRLAHLGVVLGGSLVFASVYLVYMWRSEWWDAEDRALYYAILRSPT